jgi:phosphatidylserine decarboxylase
MASLLASPLTYRGNDEIEGLLSLEVISAEGLPAMDLNGKADPFFVVDFAGREHYKSHIVYKSRAPVWNETVKVTIAHSEKNYTVELKVFDWDKTSSNDFIGSTSFEISQLFGGKTHDWTLPLKNAKKKDKEYGTIHLRARILDKSDVEFAFWSAFAKHFDTDGSGTINRIEFSAMLGSIHTQLTEAEITHMFEKADTDKSGEISFDEAYKLFTMDPKLVASLTGHDPNFIWYIYAKSDDFNTVGNLVLNKNLVHTHTVTVDKSDRKVIMIHERESGKLVEEKIPHYIDVSLRIMYSTHGGRTAVENTQIRKLLHHLSAVQGKKYDDPRSKKEIPHFIQFHGLNTDEILDPLDSFANFNEFFYRKLKASARTIAEPNNPKVAVSPADCRLHVFPQIDTATSVWIKGKNFNLQNLLRDDQLATKFNGGSLVIARLAPQDYHRFHLPVDCIIGTTKPIDGALYTVNPIAIREEIDVYTENKRNVTLLESSEFGQVVYISVGATMVGSIRITSKEGQKAKKGDEHGYFAFGGSTILLLFQPGKIVFDNDLLVNSAKPIETLVKMGEGLGLSTKP